MRTLERDVFIIYPRWGRLNHEGRFIAVKKGIVCIKKDAKSDGATKARDENGELAWFCHDNLYWDLDIPVSRKEKDIFMMYVLKINNFRWFRKDYYKKFLSKKFNGIKMHFIYYLGVRLGGWWGYKTNYKGK